MTWLELRYLTRAWETREHRQDVRSGLVVVALTGISIDRIAPAPEFDLDEDEEEEKAARDAKNVQLVLQTLKASLSHGKR